MARRPTKLQFHEHRVTCPYCRTAITITSLMEIILTARRNCPICKREMLISNGRAVKLSVKSTKKSTKQIRSRISKAKD